MIYANDTTEFADNFLIEIVPSIFNLFKEFAEIADEACILKLV